MNTKPTVDDYRALAAIRHRIRGYINFSQRTVHNAGLEPRQYQLMLALKALPDNVRPRITELARQLEAQHHSTVELVNRSEQMGLVRREHGTVDKRERLIRLTVTGERVIEQLVKLHLAEMDARGPNLLRALQTVLCRNGTKRKIRVP